MGNLFYFLGLLCFVRQKERVFPSAHLHGLVQSFCFLPGHEGLVFVVRVAFFFAFTFFFFML